MREENAPRDVVGRYSQTWLPSQIEELKRYYPLEKTENLLHRFSGFSYWSIKRKAIALGLRKSTVASHRGVCADPEREKLHRHKISNAMKRVMDSPEARRRIAQLNASGFAHRFANGNGNPNWKGGRLLHYYNKGRYPYIVRLIPGRGYVLEHRLVMEQVLGRTLRREEQVHHRNGIKTDNRPENLQMVAKPHYGEVSCPFCEKEFLIK